MRPCIYIKKKKILEDGYSCHLNSGKLFAVEIIIFACEESNKIHFLLIARKNTERRKVGRAPKRIKTRTTVQGKKGGDPPF